MLLKDAASKEQVQAVLDEGDEELLLDIEGNRSFNEPHMAFRRH